MSSSQSDLSEYQGRIVSQSYHGGFIALSCLVSFIGTASTLELINRRTGFRGFFNHILFVGSSVTMGGVAIWSMHFIANRAMELASGEPEMQVSYSPGFTVLSFFVPIAVLLTAFIAVGSNDSISWWRISAGGLICGVAVCGMHYLGNASISNYHCIYRVANVVGSAIIAVIASVVSLSTFFAFRAMWANSWWKRILSAVILACAVSGMHWCAALGTRYRFISTNRGSAATRDATVIVVICLAIGASFVIAGSIMITARSMAKSAQKAQKITLAAAVFDKHGRILVDTNGLVPSAVVTDSFLEKNKDSFGVSHPLFHWMFQATRDWTSISSLIADMRNHLSKLPQSGRGKDGRTGMSLIDSLGQLIEDYDIIFRELFCLAAQGLAERLKEQLASVGVLWDEILPTGVQHFRPDDQNAGKTTPRRNATPSDSDKAEKGEITRNQQRQGGGSLMFLVRRVRNDREAERLTTVGYRFAELRQVSGLIRSRMQIQTADVEGKLRQMAAYADGHSQPPARVSLGFFGIKARVDKSGFDVMTQKTARNLLPVASLGLDKLEAWHLNFLRRFESMPASQVLEELALPAAANVTPREKAFASRFSRAARELKEFVRDPLFDEAQLTLTAVSVPQLDQAGMEVTTKLLAFRMLIPIHASLTSPNCEFIPLSFFKVRQLSQKQQLEFTQGIHRELGPVIKNLSERAGGRTEQQYHDNVGAGWSRRPWKGGRRGGDGSEVQLAKVSGGNIGESDDKIMPVVSHRKVSSLGSTRTPSTDELCPTDSRRRMSDRSDVESSPEEGATVITAPPAQQAYSGILVSQEITVDDADSDNEGEVETYGYPGRLTAWSPAAREAAGMDRKATSKLGIELGPVGKKVVGIKGRPRTATGQGEGHVHAHAVAGPGADMGRTVTFVDILLGQCVVAYDDAQDWQ